MERLTEKPFAIAYAPGIKGRAATMQSWLYIHSGNPALGSSVSWRSSRELASRFATREEATHALATVPEGMRANAWVVTKPK